MACIETDGSLTASAKALLNALSAGPQTAAQISARSGEPLFKVRSNLREMSAAGLIDVEGEKFALTEEGRSRR